MHDIFPTVLAVVGLVFAGVAIVDARRGKPIEAGIYTVAAGVWTCASLLAAAPR